jgi:helix-turn-helix protein
MGSVLPQHVATAGKGAGVAVDPEAVTRRLFGVVLRHLRTEAGLSLRELGKRCHHDYSRLSRMETGEHLGDPALLAEIDRILGAGGLLTVLRAAAELPSDPPSPPGPVVSAPAQQVENCVIAQVPAPGTLPGGRATGTREFRPLMWVSPGAWTAYAEREFIMATANQAGGHAERAGAGNVEEATLDQLHDHVTRLAQAYLTGPMLPLFGELVAVRNRVYDLLEVTQRLAQRRDLYLIAGQLSCLLAGTSCDLGYPKAGIEQAWAACTYGELIGHDGLWAYAQGQLATFFSLDG